MELLNTFDGSTYKLVFTKDVSTIPSYSSSILEYQYKYYQLPPSLRMVTDTYALLTNVESYLYLTTSYANTKDPRLTNYITHVALDHYLLYPISSTLIYPIDPYQYYSYTLPILKKISPESTMTIFNSIRASTYVTNTVSFGIQLYLCDVVGIPIHQIKTLFFPGATSKVVTDQSFSYEVADLEHVVYDIGENDHLFIQTDALYPSYACYQEILNLPYQLFIVGVALKHLKKGGNLYLYVPDMFISYTYIGFLYTILSCFSSIRYYPNPLIPSGVGMFYFENYCGKSPFPTLIKEYKKKDSSMGWKNHIVPTGFTYDFCSPISSTTNSWLISSMVDSIHPSFIHYIQTILTQCSSRHKRLYHKAIEFSPDQLENTLMHHIHQCIQFCKQKHIPIHPIYSMVSLFSYQYYIKQYFIPKKIDYNKIRLSVDSNYTSLEDAKQMIDYIKQFKVHTLVDSHGNSGAFSILASYEFKHVYACEVDRINYAFLKNNISVYGRKNITPIHGSVLEVHVPSSCLFLDYTSEDDSSILEWLSYFITITSTSYISIKLPKSILPLDYDYELRKVCSFVKLYEFDTFYFLVAEKN